VSAAAENGERIAGALRLARPGFELDVDLDLPAAGVTALFGPSGSGKTTLLRCIAGLEPRVEGWLTVAGEPWLDSAAGIHRPAHRRAVGYVFQESALFRHRSVAGNLAYAHRRTPPSRRALGVTEIAERFRIPHLLDRAVGSLSGGERQRVAIARAMITAPGLLLMDEPLASVDEAGKAGILAMLDELRADSPAPILYVSHQVAEVARFADRVLVLGDGRPRAEGPVGEVLADLDASGAPAARVRAVIDGTVRNWDRGDGIARVAFAGGELELPLPPNAPGARIRCSCEAGDVSLCRERPSATSILNVVPVVVEALDEVEPAHVLVRCRAGETPIPALITRRSRRVLDLAVGDTCFAQIKAVAIA